MPQPQPPSPGRPEPSSLAELRRLRDAQPELASAIDLQIEWLQIERRVRLRLPLPSLSLDPSRVRAELAAGRPLLRFADIPLNWGDVRYLVRTAAELMYRHEALEEADFRRAAALARGDPALERLVRHWFAIGVEPAAAAPESAALEPVILLAMRPFLVRCAEACAHLDFSPWRRGCCPLCGGEPELSLITPAAERRLVCSRCTTQWGFDAIACPFCGNDDRSAITSFASRDGLYRLAACHVCRRYVKAFDARHAPRPFLLEVDAIATLPLDAAAMQRGYRA